MSQITPISDDSNPLYEQAQGSDGNFGTWALSLSGLSGRHQLRPSSIRPEKDFGSLALFEIASDFADHVLLVLPPCVGLTLPILKVHSIPSQMDL